MRSVWTATGLMVLTLWSGCSADAFWVTVVFPDEQAREQTRALAVFALEPEAESGCASLQAGSVVPGDPGYAIEDHVIVYLPEQEGNRPLKRIGPGLRLFFAEAQTKEGNPILRGCAAVETGGGGTRSVILTLAWTCQPSNGGVETCDDLDNDCDGETDDGDPEFLCPEVPRARATGCNGGRCDYACLPGWFDTNSEWSDGCECHLTRQGVEWCDGLDNDCDGETDGAGCQACSADADCADPLSCLEGICDPDHRCTAETSPDDTPCDDGVYCTTDDQCQAGICEGALRACDPMDDECNRGVCDEESRSCVAEPRNEGGSCDDGAWCSTGDACAGGVCTGLARDCSEADAECILGTCDEDADRCVGQPVADGTGCDDGSYCTVGEGCQGGSCQGGQPRDCSASGTGCVDGVCDEGADRCVGDPLPPGTACDDELACTENDVCDGLGTCVGDPTDCSSHDGPCRLGTCAEQQGGCVAEPVADGVGCDDDLFCTENDRCVAGACTGDDRVCPVSSGCEMATCDDQADACEVSYLPEGSFCDDGLACTLLDLCDAQGSCTGTPDASACAGGTVCAPDCALDPTGCVAPPDLVLDCPDTGPVSGPLTCALSAGGVEGMEGCLQCTAHLTPALLSRVDFTLDGSPGSCDLDGWQLEAIPCNDTAREGRCQMRLEDPGPDCRTDFMCPVREGVFAGHEALEADKTDNDGLEEWRLSRTFDFRSFDAADVVFFYARTQAGLDNALQLQVDAGDDPDGDSLFCTRSSQHPREVWQWQGEGLPSFWMDQPSTRITFWIHSDNPGDGWLLDDIRVTAWNDECPRDHDTVFFEDFYLAPNPLTDGWGGWTVTGSPECDRSPCGSWTLVATAGTATSQWTIARQVDTSALGEVNLCWQMGDSDPGDAVFEVRFDAGGGDEVAFSSVGDLQPGQNLCSRDNCVRLSDLNPQAAGNPSLGVAFSVDAQAGTVVLDSIGVTGDGLCDATGLAAAGPVEPGPVAGTYTLQVQSQTGDAYHVELECSWNGLNPVSERFTFVP